MTHAHRPTLRRVAFGLLLLGASSASMAATIPFSYSYVAVHDPSRDGSNYYGSDEDANSGPPSAASAAVSSSGDWGSASATARADLITGQLGGSASGNLTGQGVYQYNNIYSQTNALFGDGFRTFDTAGNPFTWQGGATARFGITIDGDLSASPSLESVNGGAWVTLFLFQPGTMTSSNIFGVQPNMIGYYQYLIGNPNLSVTSYGPAEGAADDLPLIPTAYAGSLNNGPVTITQDFTPNGDFDWALLLGAYSFASNPGDNFNLDLSHTVTFNYQGPEGSNTESVSGLFDNYSVPTSVPEPGTITLMGLGLVGLALSRRRRVH